MQCGEQVVSENEKKRAERKKRRDRTKHLIPRKESGKTAEKEYESWDKREENKMKDAIYNRVEMEQINEHHLCIQICPLFVKSGL